MPSTPNLTPSWLDAIINSHTHFDHIHSVLAARESKRERARSATRHSYNSSRRRRSLIGSSIVAISRQPPREVLEHFSVETGSKEENLKLNRYYAIEPFDRTRVLVGGSSTESCRSKDENEKAGKAAGVEEDGRYLNANWVRELHGGKWWVATQAPLPNTAHTFLSLFLQSQTRPPRKLSGMKHDNGNAGSGSGSNSGAGASTDPNAPWEGPCRLRTAVQLTLMNEGGRPKAHQYFPTEIGQSYIIPPHSHHAHTHTHTHTHARSCHSRSHDRAIKITLEEQITHPHASAVQSTLRLVYCQDPPGEPDEHRWSRAEEVGTPVRVTHLLFSSWPDFGVPEGPEEKAALLSFARLVEKVNREIPPEEHLLHPPYNAHAHAYKSHPNPPIVVNCSAGVGRTGSFIAINSLLRSHGLLLPVYPPSSLSDFPPLHSSPLGPLPEDVAMDKVATEVDSLREQRTSMVQKSEQMMLVYELLAAAYHEKHERQERKRRENCDE